jgi:ferredoxin
MNDPGGAEGVAQVPAGPEDALIEASEECPDECLFIVSE